MNALSSALQGAFTGRGGLYLLAGEPGIGKTRLAVEFAAMAEGEGARVYWGRCWEAGGAPAYWPWIQSLRELVDELPLELLDAVVGGDGPVLAQMLPELRERVEETPSRPASADVARFRLFDALSRFLARASEIHPFVLVLEDLHAADPSSLLLLQFLSGALVSTRLLVLGTYRQVELTRDHPLAGTITELVRGPATVRVELAGLNERDAGQLIEAVSGQVPTKDAVEAIHRGTNGNPLFVGEVVRLLVAEEGLGTRNTGPRMSVPEGLRGVIGRRLDRLPAECRDVLATASVFGHDFAADALGRVTVHGVDAVLDLLHRAVTIQLLVPVSAESGRFRFAHALVRDALYGDIPQTERVRLHRSVGEALEDLYSTDPGPHVAELAYHFLHAAPTGALDKAVEYAVAAGRRAVELLAYEEAVRLFEMAYTALRDSPDEQLRCEVLLLLGDAEARAGATPASKATLLDASGIATRLDAPELLARVALAYAGRVPWLRAGTDRHVVPLLRQALGAVGDDDGVLRVLLLSRLAGALRDQPSIEPRAAFAEEAVAMARRIGDPETLIYALLAQWAAILMGPDWVGDALVVAEELNALAEQVQDRERLCDAHLARYVALMTTGRVWEAREESEALNRVAQELSQPSQLFYTAVTAQVLLLQDGRFEEAERLVQDHPGREAQPWDAGFSRLLALFILRREQGRLTELEEELRHAPADYPGYRSIRCMLLALLCDLGRDDEARSLFDHLAGDEFAGFPKDGEWLFALTLLAEAAHALNDRARAAVLYDQLRPYADLVGLAACEISIGPVGRPLGLVASVVGRQDEASAHYEDALERCRRMGARPWAAHTQYAYAEVLATTGIATDRRRAIQMLRSALETARETGMIALAGRVEERLIQLGVQRTGCTNAPGPQPAAVETALTPREREVAALLAEGSSNRHIAERLYLSERTVETHVQNILMKLGFNSRTQIARWVLTEGTTEATT